MDFWHYQFVFAMGSCTTCSTSKMASGILATRSKILPRQWLSFLPSGLLHTSSRGQQSSPEQVCRAPQLEAQPASAVDVCPRCNTPIVNPDGEFCEGCGTRVKSSPEQIAIYEEEGTFTMVAGVTFPMVAGVTGHSADWRQARMAHMKTNSSVGPMRIK